MKIEIDMMDNGIPYLAQMKAVDNYIEKYTTKIEEYDYLGKLRTKENLNTFDITLCKKLVLKETSKNTAVKVEVTFSNYHVTCRKTKAGTYKFKVWQAV